MVPMMLTMHNGSYSIRSFLSHLGGKTVAVVHGRTAALFSMEYFGCCALERHGPICLIAIHRIKPANDGCSNEYARAS
jgi:hypothetical protein